MPKMREQLRDDAIHAEDVIVQLRGRSGEVGRQVGVERGDRFAQRRSERIGALPGMRPDDDRGELRAPAARREAACKNRRCRFVDRTDPASTYRARRRRSCATVAACRD